MTRAMMVRTTMLSASLALASFAANGIIGMKDCKNVDWFKFGFRDGSMSGRSSLDEYNAYCAKQGVVPDAARYAKGLSEGQMDKQFRQRY